MSLAETIPHPQQQLHHLPTGNALRGRSLTRSRRERGGQESDSRTLLAFASPREYFDIPGFCKSATLAEIAAQGFVLTPCRYVGAEDVEDDGEPFEEKMGKLTAELSEQFAESAKLEIAIRKNLEGLGYAL